MYVQGLKRLSPPVRRLSSRVCRPRALHSTSKRRQGDAKIVRPSNSPTAALSAEAVDALWQTARKRLAAVPKVPSPSSIAGALLLIPVAGGAWFVTVYALRQRLCEHRLQQVPRQVLDSSPLYLPSLLLGDCPVSIMLIKLITISKAANTLRLLAKYVQKR